jgi:hypothetical protein
MATKNYIPVAGDDWYERRRQDPEGEFFRKVADQGPRKGEGGSTRQGIYCLTASGKLLVYKNAGQAPDMMRDVLRRGLAEWAKLPADERRPAGSQVKDDERVDRQYSRMPPVGGLILNVYARMLDRNAQGELQPSEFVGEAGMRVGASHDHLWLTQEEWQSLVPARREMGLSAPVPAGIAERIVRFHLVDNTRGEPPMWGRDQIRLSELLLTVEEIKSTTIRLRLDGSALLATDALLNKAKRGYEVRLLGYIDYDVPKKSIERFDIVAVGDHWGESTYVRGARPGRTPLGIAFELAHGDVPGNRVPPQAARELQAYFSAGR